MRQYETPEDYAQRMADKTRKVHVITKVGNVLALEGNEELIKDCGGVAAVFLPRREGR